MVKIKRVLILILLSVLSLHAQEDIEQYLLTDSLEIEALVNDESPQEKPGFKAFTSLGLTGRQFAKHSDLNQSLLNQGYGQIPEASPGWTYAIRFDIKDHVTLGFSYQSNLFLSNFQQGATQSSKFTYFSFLLNFGYRHNLAAFHIIPGMGLGFSQSILSLKPNQMESLAWDDLFANNDLVTAINQTDLALSADISLGKYVQRGEKGTKLLNLKVGMIFHPFSFGESGISGGEFTFVKVTEAPSLSNSGLFLALTWG